MKKYNTYLFFVLTLLFLQPIFAVGQIPKTDEMAEKVSLFTDRSIYINGEQLQFFATLFEGETIDTAYYSHILYCELITPDGKKIVAGKYLLNNQSTRGCLDIPADIITGTYYLRAYTKQMRNYGPHSYAYCQVRIINPQKSEMLEGEISENMPDLLRVKSPEVAIMLDSDKKAYSPGEKIRITVGAPIHPAALVKSLCLSVVPEKTEAKFFYVDANTIQPQPEAIYYTENRGLSLTGKLTEASAGNTVKGKRVNLSIIGEGRDFMAVRSNADGRFHFALPDYYGSHDIFLSAEKTENAELKIWVDNDFCAAPISLPAPVFILTEEERQAAFKMALNMQVSSHFKPDSVPELLRVKRIDKAFYGEPANIIYLDQYIQLPTLEEYFNELPGLVKVRKRGNDKYFKVSGPQDLSFFDPLILVDWVAVDETPKVLAIAPQNIARIEIVNKAYVKGEQTYGGIISIISKKGDFAGIDLPTTGIFVNYQFLAENTCHEMQITDSDHFPDARNTLFWQSVLNPEPGKTSEFVCTAPDVPGRYVICVQGISEKGERVAISVTIDIVN